MQKPQFFGYLNIWMNSEFGMYFKGNWSMEQLAEMGINSRESFNPYNQMHNKFADQVLHDNLAGEYVDVNGVQSIYYVASLDTKRDPIYREDPTQTMERVFHIKIAGDETIAADKVKFGRFVFEGMDEINVYVHRMTFFKMNYINLQQHNIAPKLDPRDHNPIISERDGTGFNYMGYTKEQIFPKASDLIKPEWAGKMYELTDVSTEIPDQTFLQRRYFFRITMRQYADDHRDFNRDVANSGFNTSGFIEDKFDRYTDLNVSPNIQGHLDSNGNTVPIPVESPKDLNGMHQRYWGNIRNSNVDSEGRLVNHEGTPVAIINNENQVVPADGSTRFEPNIGQIKNKDEVTFRPKLIPPGTKNISDDLRFRPSPFGRA